ncbi:hypothetical protein GOV12_05010 [Candidatus Pacearchaeota archaeon]|nr:hypothetical protein [Candidatus Pacearchaeota archaeon]
MPSAILYLGRRGLTIEKFERFVKPHLEKKGYSVYDVADVSDRKDGKLLVSLSAEKCVFENLDQVLEYVIEMSNKHNESLREKATFEDYNQDEDYAPDPYSINFSEVAVQFRDDDSATKSFETFYQDYITSRTQTRTTELTQQTTKLTKNLDALENRVKALADKKLSQFRN